MYNFFDIHSHLHDRAFALDRERVISEMKQKGLGTITVGTGLKESREAVALADSHENIFASIGLHPADNVLEEYDDEAFRKLAQHKKVLAIGECGLDYYYIENFFEKDVELKGIKWNKEEEKERQKRVFKKQISLAVEINKPLMLHGRPTKGSMDAYEDMLFILEEEYKKSATKLKGNAHFFVGDIDIARRFIDMGFTLSFSGVITFSHDYDDIVRFTPIEMLHAETDSPYATPAPFRGKRNSSLLVQEIVARIAVLREEPMEEVRENLVKNANRVFNIS